MFCGTQTGMHSHAQMTPPYKPWFLSLVYSEVFLQLPFFFVGAYAFLGESCMDDLHLGTWHSEDHAHS